MERSLTLNMSSLFEDWRPRDSAPFRLLTGTAICGKISYIITAKYFRLDWKLYWNYFARNLIQRS